MSLLSVHRLLIQVFAAAAIVFGWIMIRHWKAGDPGPYLPGAIVAFALALGALIYLFRAPHLRRK